ncbi:MAG TPA: hypothetical protein VJ875_20655 [Pyrinomonadaceae bacterium]|nr:hypothetical protein [Pyrinomonadaceae bacterium]
MKRRLIHRSVTIAFIALPMLFLNASNVSAQANREAPLRELLKAPGKLISEAKSARPTTDLRLTGYRVEEIQLPRSLTVEVRGQQVAVDKAWRVTVQGGPFPVRALPAVIWIDDQIVGTGIENETLSQITAITFDSSLIRAGGAVSISYGDDKDNRRTLSQKLQLKREGENQ